MRQPMIGIGARTVWSITALLAASAAAEEPSYQGKPVSHWVGNLSAPTAAGRFQAAKALAAIGGPAVPALVEALKLTDETPRFRAAVAETLGKIGPPAKDSVAALTAMTAEKTTEVRL